jgi:hypothetical protein
METAKEIVGDAKVLGPDDGESHWQPVPATLVRNHLATRR